jgi:hypothetical protein
MDQAQALPFLPAPNPPKTPRELLHLVLGDAHALCSVKLWDKDNLGATVWCSCGKRVVRIEFDSAQRLSRDHVEYALAMAPRRTFWGMV